MEVGSVRSEDADPEDAFPASRAPTDSLLFLVVLHLLPAYVSLVITSRRGFPVAEYVVHGVILSSHALMELRIGLRKGIHPVSASALRTTS